ncbi:MAG TPA: hypothetical protein VFC67_06035 [Prolixibacteraceae bacterium]|nr:hypothetical protein [Prolixibacteraceae bacterium]
MCRLISRIVLILGIFVIISGRQSRAAGFVSSVEEMKYQVTFGDSYHNYLPGSLLRIGVIIKNNSSENVKISQELVVVDSAGVNMWNTVINLELQPKGSVTIPLMVPVGNLPGTFTLTTSAFQEDALIPNFVFNVIQPKKSLRLSKILVHTPDSEEDLNKFLKSWDIKAPTISWGQVLLLGKKSWSQYDDGDKEIIQLVDRSLKREMSVIFIDFGPVGKLEDPLKKTALPYDVTVSFIKAKAPEQEFVLKSDYKELIYDFSMPLMTSWNGRYGVNIPATDMRFEGSGVKIIAYATTGENPFRFPIVELIPKNGKGKLYLSQILTEGRLDETVISPRRQSELPTYDPMAVQFLLNLISTTVGDNLLK